MNTNIIPLDQCKHGYVYKIASRNLDYGVFNKEDNGFIGIREKFSSRYLFTEYHYDTGAPFGTVTPLQELEKVPDDIVINGRDTHSNGDDWAVDPVTNEVEPVIRRDLQEGETPHGKRQGFVDLWAKTGERLPDDRYPFLRDNGKIFQYLEGICKKYVYEKEKYPNH